MNSTNELIANEFYNAFANKNAEGMNKFYHKSLHFEDPAFGKLNYEQTCSMWTMLCESAKDLGISFKIIDSDENSVTTKWIADYRFSKTNRMVHNEIVAVMKIENELIVEHNDTFNLHKWAQQALGMKGYILGGTKFFRNKLQEQTGRQLLRYIQKKQPRVIL